MNSNNPDDEVWGVAYKIATEDVDSVVNHLDFREKGGYTRKIVLFYPYNDTQRKTDLSVENNSNDLSCLNTNSLVTTTSTDSQKEIPFYLTIYIGAEDNPNFAGTETLDTIASHIVNAHGPSGSNIEYLYKLASAMKMIAPGINDDHLFTLERAVRQLDNERANIAHLCDD